MALLASLQVCASGCVSPPAGPATEVLAKPSDDLVRGVRNFAKISPALWRGSQPTADGFHGLEEAGARTVVNLRHDHDDAPLLAGTRLRYIWIPTRPWALSEDDLVSFFKVIRDPDNRPVFVHCWKGNDRTGFFVAAYRIVVDGWRADDAIRELFLFDYNPLWFEIPGALRDIDAADLRVRITGQ
ncbi:MAG: tyrosine-protein phosphatase [Planctomycetota bacterium]|nr:tyrosine-protein phosphatase [Planctomycetota bacterium]